MNKRRLLAVAVLVEFVLILSCGGTDTKMLQEGEQLAHQYCASCHAFPEPDLLDKKTWADNVLPVMAQFMKVDVYYEPFNNSGPAGDVNVERTNAKDLFPFEKWKKIVAWYSSQAPERPLPRKESLAPVKQNLPFFDVIPVYAISAHPLTTYVGFDSTHRTVLFGDGLKGNLFELGKDYKPAKLFDLPTGIADLRHTNEGMLALTMGLLQPSDQRAGKLISLVAGQQPVVVIDSLQRPVRMALGDLDGDGKDDIVISEFGFRNGSLSWFKNEGSGYTKNVLRALPGASDISVRDLNGDGMPDVAALMSQGDEGVFFYYNEGRGRFREQRILQFPPAYGSNYFEMVDLNGDGIDDILTTQGDNGDASNILKYYHGIRLFLNVGKDRYTQSTFLPVNGAQKALARDFDKDGDIDLASVASFPDWAHPEESFIYWENKGNWRFERYTFPLVEAGRWMTLDASDIDDDGDLDLLLGNANFSLGDVPETVKTKWKVRPVSLIVLKNRSRK